METYSKVEAYLAKTNFGLGAYSRTYSIQQCRVCVPFGSPSSLPVRFPSRKSKDDLFDDIFSKEDKGTKETDGLAEMLGDDDTSPKRSSHRKHHHQSGSSNARKSLKEDYAKKERESPIKKIPQLKMENGKYDGKKSKSPEETIIPGLEPVVSIPGLESPMKDEVTEVEREISESKIPLLFDDEPSPEKTGVPKTPELSPEEEQELKKRQPYTPPEEFTGEPENNQFDSYYHIEADDSPYNPEDLMPMDMDFSPVDASNIQRDALKEAVQMRLKEPFSGYENPTWEKIIKAKSKHELKRQKRKSHQEKGRSHEHRPSRQVYDKMHFFICLLHLLYVCLILPYCYCIS